MLNGCIVGGDGEMGASFGRRPPVLEMDGTESAVKRGRRSSRFPNGERCC